MTGHGIAADSSIIHHPSTSKLSRCKPLPRSATSTTAALSAGWQPSEYQTLDPTARGLPTGPAWAIDWAHPFLFSFPIHPPRYQRAKHEILLRPLEMARHLKHRVLTTVVVLPFVVTFNEFVSRQPWWRLAWHLVLLEAQHTLRSVVFFSFGMAQDTPLSRERSIKIPCN